MSNERDIRTSVIEDLLFQRRLQRNLNTELERLNMLLSEQVRLLAERKALMAEVHQAVQRCWSETTGIGTHELGEGEAADAGE